MSNSLLIVSDVCIATLPAAMQISLLAGSRNCSRYDLISNDSAFFLSAVFLQIFTRLTCKMGDLASLFKSGFFGCSDNDTAL